MYNISDYWSKKKLKKYHNKIRFENNANRTVKITCSQSASPVPMLQSSDWCYDGFFPANNHRFQFLINMFFFYLTTSSTAKTVVVQQ